MDARQAGSIFIVIIFFGSTVAFAINWVFPQEREEGLPNVFNNPLNPAQISSLIDQDLAVLTFFYVVGCRFCEATEPEIEQLARQFPERLVIIELDAAKHQSLALSYNVRGVPVILIHGKGLDAPVRLEGQKDYLEIKQAMCQVFLEKPFEC